MNIKYVLAALLIASSASTAMAQTTDTQKFTITIPGAISIVAPDNVTMTHDASENDQTFPTQGWVVSGNTLSGVTATLKTLSHFQHVTDATAKRNAQLDLAISSTSGSAAWTVTQASDVTDYDNNDGEALVQASSDGSGVATLGVDVTFVTDGFGSFPAGDYETTVEGTVTTN